MVTRHPFKPQTKKSQAVFHEGSYKFVRVSGLNRQLFPCNKGELLRRTILKRGDTLIVSIFSLFPFPLSLNSHDISRGWGRGYSQGGGGTLIFFRIRRLGPSIYRSPPKNIRNFKHPQKIFEILATQKSISFLYLDLKKVPKLHRNDPQTSPICDDPKKISTKSSYPQRYSFF